MKLRTERLTLRPPTPADADDWARLLADPETMRFSLNGPLPREEADAKLDKVIRCHADNGWGLWLVFDKNETTFHGYCGLIPQYVDGVDEIELGYRLLPQFWGKGIATEAAIACKRHAFEELGIERLISLIAPENVGSTRVAEKCGLEFEKETTFLDIAVCVYGVQS